MAFNRAAIRSGVTHLNVSRNGREVTLAISKMTDEELKRALQRPDNRSALAPGWTLASSGAVIREVAPTNTPRPETISTPTPGSTAPGPTQNTGPLPAPPVQVRPEFNREAIKPSWSHLFIKEGSGYKTVKIENLSDSQIRAALKDPKNSGAIAPGWAFNSGGHLVRVPGAPGGRPPGADNPVAEPAPADPAPADPAPEDPAPAPAAPVPVVTAPVAPPSWIPPMIGLGGINVDPTSGKIDWASLIQKANGVSAVDPEYAQMLSANIAQAMQSLALPQAEIQSLQAVNPATGKTVYQTMFDNALRNHNQAASSSMSNAAMRGIASSGMSNQNLAANGAQFVTQQNDITQKFGAGRIADLLKQMTGTLAEQDQNFASSYYAALSRANQRIPGIPDPTTGG